MRRLRTLVAVAALSVSALVLTATRAEAGTTSLKRGVSEAMKEVSVKLHLIDKLGVDALGISVDVVGDKATLSGTVAKAASKGLASEVALSVDGIRNVDNNVVEKTPANAVGATEAAVKNASLELRVKAVLLEAIGTNAFKVEVEASDGVVSLRGKPDDPATARVAVRKVEALKGVRKVVDLLG